MDDEDHRSVHRHHLCDLVSMETFVPHMFMVSGMAFSLLLLLHIEELLVLGYAGRFVVCNALLHAGTCTLEPQLPLPLSRFLVFLCPRFWSRAR